jgi:hypothetical protein
LETIAAAKPRVRTTRTACHVYVRAMRTGSLAAGGLRRSTYPDCPAAGPSHRPLPRRNLRARPAATATPVTRWYSAPWAGGQWPRLAGNWPEVGVWR